MLIVKKFIINYPDVHVFLALTPIPSPETGEGRIQLLLPPSKLDTQGGPARVGTEGDGCPILPIGLPNLEDER